jgi:hypothetical protein
MANISRLPDDVWPAEGDVGLAVYLWDCLTGEPRFPTIDVF